MWWHNEPEPTEYFEISTQELCEDVVERYHHFDAEPPAVYLMSRIDLIAELNDWMDYKSWEAWYDSNWQIDS